MVKTHQCIRRFRNDIDGEVLLCGSTRWLHRQMSGELRVPRSGAAARVAVLRRAEECRREGAEMQGARIRWRLGQV